MHARDEPHTAVAVALGGEIMGFGKAFLVASAFGLTLMIAAECPRAYADEYWAVCTQRRVAGVDAAGRKVYCTSCRGPFTVASDSAIDLPKNCQWFYWKDKAYEYASQVCDCD
jgi:hypothetical protein